MKMAKRKGDKLTLDEVEDMIEEGVLSVDEESECSEDEDFEPVSSNLPSSSESSEESSDDSSDEDNEPHTEIANRTGRNGTYWRSDTPPPSRTPRHNIMHEQPGPKRTVIANSPSNALELFLSEEILDEVCKCTNLEGRRVASSRSKRWNNVSKEELLAYFGLVLLAGSEKQWDVSTRELFGNDFSNPMYKATMSVERFEDIRRFLRFDDKRTREFRLQTDHMAAFRYIWKLFISNCKKWYSPHECVTIDEQLVAFKGRCRFLQYIPTKPGKYGIKIFWLCDSITNYGFNGSVYTGRQPGEEVKRNVGSSIVHELCSPLQHSGRNVTADNFFTSVQLAESLLNKNLTLVGTLRQNKPDIPPIMKASKSRERYSTEFGFKGNTTMVSYVPKKGKAVIMLSTMHHDKAIDEGSSKKKPEVIQYYNGTKAGVDTFDQMIRTYSCKRQTKRWPVVMWYNLLDVAALNAFLIFSTQNSEFEVGKTHKRRLFLRNLAKELVIPQMRRRLRVTTNLRSTVLVAMERCGVRREENVGTVCETPVTKRKRCHYCPSKKDRKSAMVCKKCNKNVCKEHSHVVCNNCL